MPVERAPDTAADPTLVPFSAGGGAVLADQAVRAPPGNGIGQSYDGPARSAMQAVEADAGFLAG